MGKFFKPGLDESSIRKQADHQYRLIENEIFQILKYRIPQEKRLSIMLCTESNKHFVLVKY